MLWKFCCNIDYTHQVLIYAISSSYSIVMKWMEIKRNLCSILILFKYCDMILHIHIHTLINIISCWLCDGSCNEFINCISTQCSLSFFHSLSSVEFYSLTPIHMNLLKFIHCLQMCWQQNDKIYSFNIINFLDDSKTFSAVQPLLLLYYTQST